MPRLIPDPNVPNVLQAIDEDGRVVARGYLEVPFIPEGYGGQIVSGLQFVTIEPTSGGLSADQAAAALTAGEPQS